MFSPVQTGTALDVTGSPVYRTRADGIDLMVRLTPKSSSDAIDGIGVASDGRAHVAARVRAVPDKGQANAALERLIADSLDLPRRTVSVVAGSTSRLKTVRLSGDPQSLAGAVDKAVSAPSKSR